MIEVRTLEEHAEFAEAVRLQRTIWGFEDLELLPVRFFVVAHTVGGQTIGAFDGSRMVGFLLGIPGGKFVVRGFGAGIALVGTAFLVGAM